MRCMWTWAFLQAKDVEREAEAHELDCMRVGSRTTQHARLQRTLPDLNVLSASSSAERMETRFDIVHSRMKRFDLHCSRHVAETHAACVRTVWGIGPG
jgi:hypothetical protein